MSRYFELMQASERDQETQLRQRGESAAPSAGDDRIEKGATAALSKVGSTHSLVALPRLQPRQPKTAQASVFRSLLESCFRHPRSFLTVAGATLLVTLLVILYFPQRYQATMQLMVLNNPGARTLDEGEANAQAVLLRSRDVLGEVLEQMGGPVSPPFARDKAINELARTLQIEPVRGSNLLRVSYRDSTTERAKGTLQALANSFVSRELALLHPSRQALLSALVDQRERELAAARQDYASFASTTGIASLGDVVPLNQSESQAEPNPWRERAVAAQRNFDLAVQTRDQAAVDDALERDRIRDAAVAAKPSASSIPVQPRPLLYGAIGMLSALCLAACFCALADRRRSSVYSPAQLEALTGTATLATVPMQNFEI